MKAASIRGNAVTITLCGAIKDKGLGYQEEQGHLEENAMKDTHTLCEWIEDYLHGGCTGVNRSTINHKRADQTASLCR